MEGTNGSTQAAVNQSNMEGNNERSQKINFSRGGEESRDYLQILERT